MSVALLHDASVIVPIVVRVSFCIEQMVRVHFAVELLFPDFRRVITGAFHFASIDRRPWRMINHIPDQTYAVSGILQRLLHVRMPDDIDLRRQDILSV